jgi:uncharacterized protein involved in response to NO
LSVPRIITSAKSPPPTVNHATAAQTIPFFNSLLGLRLGTAVIIVLIGLVGGRIIPSFTRNWLVKRNSATLPAAFGRFDMATVAATTVALVWWASMPDSAAVAPLMAVAAAANLVRVARWQGHRTFTEPLVWVLHVGFLWVPIGLGLMAISPFLRDIAPSTAFHAFTGGAIATMILAVSTRATLGHTGRELRADRRTTLIYGLAVVSALARIAAGLSADAYLPLLALAGAAWFAAFALFLLVYGPMLLAARAVPTTS